MSRSSCSALHEVQDMSRCTTCNHCVHEQFWGYPGRWLCLHPFRSEIDNKGDFTYPGNWNPHVTICETDASCYNEQKKRTEALQNAKTPVWCYFEVVERSKIEQPGFDPDVQRSILWPERFELQQSMPDSWAK